jgi:hypothetical protein
MAHLGGGGTVGARITQGYRPHPPLYRCISIGYIIVLRYMPVMGDKGVAAIMPLRSNYHEQV